jgi:TolB protein
MARFFPVAAILIALAAAAPAAAQNRPVGLAAQLTYSLNMDPDPSPDGARIVFIRIVEGREQLFVMRADGKGEVQITRDAADHEDPAWSPDGRRIAFILIADGHKIVTLIDPDGGHRAALTPATQSAIHPSWTPDGRRILYCTDDDLHPPAKNESQIYAIDVATGRIATLISGGVNTYPVMSPDGRRIAFRRMVQTINSEVFIADSDGSNARNITNSLAFDGWPAWSPDGSRIAFASNRNSSYQIFTMRPDGSDTRLIANTEGRGTAPKWSRDGRQIYFTDCRNVDYGTGCEIMVAPAG